MMVIKPAGIPVFSKQPVAKPQRGEGRRQKAEAGAGRQSRLLGMKSEKGYLAPGPEQLRALATDD